MNNGAHKATLYLMPDVGSDWKWSVDVEDINGYILTGMASIVFQHWAAAFYDLRTAVSHRISALTDEEIQAILQWLSNTANAGISGHIVIIEVNQNTDGSSVVRIGHAPVNGVAIRVPPIHVQNTSACPSISFTFAIPDPKKVDSVGQDLLDMVPF